MIQDAYDGMRATAKKFLPQAIGVGIAGQIEKATGVILHAPNLRWKNVPLQQTLEMLLKLPTVVTNDVRAATWGEWVHGAGRGFDDLLCIFVGTGGVEALSLEE